MFTRTIAIGDIHGCSRALDGLIEEIKPTASDRLIFLGDYVDRGPDSRGVIDRLLSLRKHCETICLLGNHEILFRSVLGGLPAEPWLGTGGQQTLLSYGGSLQGVPAEHLAFLYQLLPYYETEKALFVHANYDSRLPMAQQTEEMLYWEHLGENPPLPHVSGKHVYLGHTPQANLEIGYFGHFTCVDTYCFGGGWLSGVDVESGEVWQTSQNGQSKKKGRILELIWRKFQSLRAGATDGG
ncbi:MAG: metallophosphoesterase family protein [Pirellulaceae bacterium]|nr:metallophosphoesterase family protein [Pirellulaceae bacterium]